MKTQKESKTAGTAASSTGKTNVVSDSDMAIVVAEHISSRIEKSKQARATSAVTTEVKPTPGRLSQSFKLLIHESHTLWEDRIDACAYLIDHFSDASNPCNNEDAILLGKSCAQQLNDKRPKVLAECIRLIEVSVLRPELCSIVAVATLPALMILCTSSKASFKKSATSSSKLLHQS